MKIAIQSITPPLEQSLGGTITVGGTRVPLDSVIVEYLAGASAEDIARDFSTLRLADVYFAIGYYLNHRPEVDAYLARREQEHQKLKVEVESDGDYQLMRERILARIADRRK